MEKEFVVGKLVFSFLATSLTYFYGGWNAAMDALLVCFFVDYFFGMLASYTVGGMASLSVHKGILGILKKLGFALLVAVGHKVDVVIGNTEDQVLTAFIYYFIANEILSIVKNAQTSGLKVPVSFIKNLTKIFNSKGRG